MSGGGASPTLGTVVVACVAVAVIRLPMVVTSGVFAVGIAVVGDFDIGVPQALQCLATASSLLVSSVLNAADQSEFGA